MRKQLKELYSAIEEAKADMTGLWALQYMIDRGIIEKGMERTLYTTYLASMFRSVRFGITEAHGRGVAMQFNYLTDEGAIKFNEANGTFSIDHAKIKDSVTKLTRELLTLEDACAATDMVAALTSVWEGEGRPVTTKGSMGQQVIHPLIGEIRTQRAARNALWRQLKLPDDAAGGESNQQRDAAQSRWSQSHGSGA